MASEVLVIGGLHAVELALERAPESALELWVRSTRKPSASLERIEAAAAHLGLAVRTAEPAALERLYGDAHHQGVVLRRRAPVTAGLTELLSAWEGRLEAPLLLLLDGVQDPRNFGACLRVADGAGVDAVLFGRARNSPVTNVAAKAASGAIDTVPLVPLANLARSMAELREAGIWLTGAADDAGQSLYELDFEGASGMVLGHEGAGLRRLTREHCDFMARIPMSGCLSSLNVATAGAVMLFEARRQRLARAAT